LQNHTGENRFFKGVDFESSRVLEIRRKGDPMAVIFPFRAVRSSRQWVAKVASYPYDIVSSEEARKIAAENPLSFLRVTKAEIDLPADVNPYDDRVYLLPDHERSGTVRHRSLRP
jgi:hypothetical protein